ncbi:MAG: hypothetical protein J6Y02_14720 [Pseudobutyrivibrio sp.]|nr:hypothetical protein [Pseudobutyrivibrio sp.]
MSDGRHRYLEVAEIVVMVNKYRPSIHPFYIANLSPYQTDAATVARGPTIAKTPLQNKDPSKVTVQSYADNGLLFIPLPKFVALTYPEKYIQPGSLWLAEFVGGDITKPIIVGRYDDHGKS